MKKDKYMSDFMSKYCGNYTFSIFRIHINAELQL